MLLLISVMLEMIAIAYIFVLYNVQYNMKVNHGLLNLLRLSSMVKPSCIYIVHCSTASVTHAAIIHSPTPIKVLTYTKRLDGVIPSQFKILLCFSINL